MKKQIYLLELSTRKLGLLLVFCFVALYASAAPYILGPSSVCTNSYASYSASYDPCSYQITWSATQNGVSLGGGAGNSFSFYVGSSTSNIVVSMNAYAMYPGGSCYSGYNTRSVSVFASITPGTPSAVTVTHYSGYLYDLSTSASGATSYEWTVTGSTIQGSATGATIRILASNACYFTYQVRAKNTNCGTKYSSYVSGSKTISAPAAPNYVSTPVYIYSGASMVACTASNEPHDPGVFSWSLADPGGALTLTPTGGITAYLSHNGSSSPLREAYVQVKRVSSCGTSATVQGLVRYGSNMRMIGIEPIAETIAVYPNPAVSESPLTVKLGDNNQHQVNKIVVTNMTGAVVWQQEVSETATEELNIQGLPKGLYLMKILKSNKESQVQRLEIK